MKAHQTVAGKPCKSFAVTAILAILFLSLFVAANDARGSEIALIDEINVQKLVNGFDVNLIKQGNIVYDGRRDKVYVSSGLTQSTIAVINTATDAVEDMFDMGVPGGTLALDVSGSLYVFNVHLRTCAKLNPETKSIAMVQDTSECQQAMDSKEYGIGRLRVWNGYTMHVESAWDPQRYQGYAPTSTQDLNGVYNKIKVMRGQSEAGAIVHGPDTMFFDVNTRTGKVYASNTGDSSVSVFDLKKLAATNGCARNSCWVKDIDLGTTLDEILPGPSGSLFIRNRLGGSAIYKYDPAARRVALFADNENNLSAKQAVWKAGNWRGGGISMWPGGFALSRNGREMYVLSHYDAAIDILDALSGAFLGKMEFQVPWKPRTDSLPEITMDYANNRMFAVWPELGLVGVADLTNRRALAMIDLSSFGFDRNRSFNRGLRLVKLAYNEKLNKLYIYLTDSKKLIMLDGTSYRGERETAVQGGLDQFNSPLLSNDEKNEIYLGNHVFDAQSIAEIDHLMPPSLNIVGFNNTDHSVYADLIRPSQPFERYENMLLKFIPGKPPQQLAIGSGSVIPAKYLFDFPGNILYAYFMAEAKIRKFDLGKMQ
ncbi:MAG: hypothetical protein PHY92_03650 [Alphaproteobacteria bacterium]|nr:hypothetical protein [Alphaproteobacteria bacterium]